MKPLPWIFLLAAAAPACEVPVFRFALERWPAEALVAEVTADSSVGPDGQAALDMLGNKPAGETPANLKLRLLDPAVPLDGHGLIRLLPVGGPGLAAADHPVWQGPLTSENARRLGHSPVRTEIAKRLLAGTSAVWIILSQGDPKSDDKAERFVRRGMARAVKELALPEGVIRPDEAAKRMAELPQATMDDVLRTTLPLEIRFECLLVDVGSPEEALFREMLVNLAAEAPLAGEALIAPFFGRGRLLAPAPESRLDEDRVYQACAWLCGACACTVKAQNPGTDLPFRTDWDAALHPHVAALDRSLPGPESVTYGKPVPPPAAQRRSSAWLSAAVIALFMVVIVTFRIRRRRSNTRGG